MVLTIGFAMVSSADIPPPPVNQNLGIDDGVFNNLVEADCRFCHENADSPVNVEGRCSETGTVCFVDDDCTGGTDVCVDVLIKDRHHILALTPENIPGASLIFNGSCVNDPTLACQSDADCVSVGGVCEAPLAFPPYSPVDPDRDNNAVKDTIYGCENCHPDDPATPIIDFIITRDCLECHVQIAGVGSVHHISATSPANDNRCFVCHGDLVNLSPGYCSEGGGITQGRCSVTATTDCLVDADCPAGEICVATLTNTCTTDADCPGGSNTCGDGHVIPTYDPSLVTPRPSNGFGPDNSYGNGRGACDFCHDQDTLPPAAPILIFSNSDTHHNTGLGVDTDRCLWCHPGGIPSSEGDAIRTCENCHGFSSLHNITVDSDAGGQVDTDGDGILDTDNLGIVVVGAENPYWSHVGNNDDCLGCHGGYIPASAPGTGPAVPYISSSDVGSMIAGADKAVTLVGSAFENYSGTYLFTSNVKMTAADGSSVTLTPDAIDQGSLTVTIPGTTAVGSYDLRVAKDDGTGTGGTVNSNPAVLSVIPGVAVTDVGCSKKKGILTVSGTGFGVQPAGSEAYINVQVDGQSVAILSWSDSEIRASVASCPRKATTTVNAVTGSATNGGDSNGGGGKPDKPCKGKKC
jgi:hypothetical protein